MITAIDVYRYHLPLRRPLAFRAGTLKEREGLLLHVAHDDAEPLWSEAAPLPGFSIESIADAESQLVRFAGLAMEASADAFRELLTEFAATACESVRFALFSIDTGLESPSRPEPVGLSVLLFGDPAQVLNRAEVAAALGFRSAKLKVGSGAVEHDIRIVREVCRILGPSVPLRLDANRAWEFPAALAFCEGIADCNIDYLEEPTSNPNDFPRIREITGVPYALDETLRDLARHDARLDDAVSRNVAALIWKPTLSAKAPSPDWSFAPGVPPPPEPARLVLSASFESGVGTAQLLRCGDAAGCLNAPPGLDTYSWLAEDVLDERLPLHGPEIDLAAVLAAAHRVDRKRLRRVYP